MAVQTQIQVRRGTAASWTSTNPTLAAGEIGLETDTGKYKIGDGSSTWTSLAYYPTLGANTFTGAQTATSFIVTGSTVPANGMYLPAANTLGFATNSTERMRIDSNGNVGIGAAAGASTTLRLNKNLTGATAAYAIVLDGSIQSDVTSNGYGIISNIRTAASAFTLTNLIHYYANPGTLGSGSTVSNQFGFFVESSLGNAGSGTLTNAYGFYSNIASASNRWNAYMNGTAANYFAGQTTVGSTSLTLGASSVAQQFGVVSTAAGNVAMVVRGAASQTGNLLQIQDSAGTVLARIDSSGNVGIGGVPSPNAKLDVNGSVTYASQVNVSAIIGPHVTSDLLLGSVNGNTPFVASQGAYPLAFNTNAVERMRIDSSGNVGIGTTSPTAKLDVNGSFTSSNYFTAGKNKIINGDFGVWARGTSFASAATAGTYTSDRWMSGTNDGTGTVTVSQQTFTAGTAPVSGYEGQYFARCAITATGTATVYNFQQRIEDVRTFAGQTVTISFWAKADSARTLDVLLDQNFGSGGSTTVGLTATAQTLTTSWARYSTSIAVSSIASKTIGTSSFLALRFRFSGASFSNTTTLDIWGVQLEAGSVATPFTTATGTIQGELAACQRYYYRWEAATAGQFGVGFSSSTTLTWVLTTFPQTMRTVPTALEQSGTAGDYTVLNAAGATACTAVPTFGNASTNTARTVLTTGATMTAGDGAMGRAANTSAYLGWSAEL